MMCASAAAAAAAASTDDHTGDAPKNHRGDLLSFLLRRGVIISDDSKAWEDPVPSGDTPWPHNLGEHLGQFDGIECEKAIVRLLRLAFAGIGDPIIRNLCHLPPVETVGTPDASVREAESQDKDMERHKKQLMTLIWRPGDHLVLPSDIDKDDLFCNAVTMHCMAVVHGTASAPGSIAAFWNSCVKALNAHCTEKCVPLVAAASLAYATDCLIERKTDQNAQPLERPDDALMQDVPALGECWACLRAYINTDVKEATLFVLEHNLSLVKLLSACMRGRTRNTIAETLAEHFGFKFDKSCSKPTLLPKEAPTLPDDFALLTDETLFLASDPDKKAHTMLMFIKTYKEQLERNGTAKLYETVINLSDLSGNRKRNFISTNEVLGDSSKSDSQRGVMDRLRERWTTALLCTCCSTTCKFRTDMIPSLSARIRTKTIGESEYKYLETEVHWADGTVTNHCAARDIIHLLPNTQALIHTQLPLTQGTGTCG